MEDIKGKVRLSTGEVFPYIRKDEQGYTVKKGDNYPFYPLETCEEVTEETKFERPETTQNVLNVIATILDAQDQKGIEKYGVTIDDASDYDWNIMAMEEMADGLKYLVKENKRLKEVFKLDLYHFYECEDCCVSFAVEQALEDQSEIRCPNCLSDCIRDVE